MQKRFFCFKWNHVSVDMDRFHTRMKNLVKNVRFLTADTGDKRNVRRSTVTVAKLVFDCEDFDALARSI